MHSLTAGLARQVTVAGVMGLLLIAGLSVSSDGVRRASRADASLDKPIPTRAIVIADAAPVEAAPIVLIKPTPVSKPISSKPAARPHLAATPLPRPHDLATQVVATAYVGPAQPADRPFDLRKQLFAPVGFVRDNVARLISRL